MLYKTGPKICLCCVHAFFFYAIVLAYFAFVSCHGVRRELIPERNLVLGKLSKKSQDDYLTLTQMMLDDHEKEQLEQKVYIIKNPAVLENFIQQTLQDRIAYDGLCKLLPKSERAVLEDKFSKAICPDEQAQLIGQYSSGLQVIKNAPMPDRKNYIDLLEILPDDQAIVLKDKVVQSTNLDEVRQRMALKIPKSFKALDDHSKESFSKLPDHQRQSILKTAMHYNDTEAGWDMHIGAVADRIHRVAQPNEKDSSAPKQAHPSKVKPDHAPTALHAPDDGYSTLCSSKPDIKKLIEQKVQEQQAKVGDDIRQDGWGSKLPLEGEVRKQFLISIMQFSQSDQKVLKALFDRTDSDSIDHFLAVYHTGFNQDARIKLLSTMIYLYKCLPQITLKLCNNPASLSTLDKMSIYQKSDPKQRHLLNQLDNLLSQ